MVNITCRIFALEQYEEFVVDLVYQESLHFVSQIDLRIYFNDIISAE